MRHSPFDEFIAGVAEPMPLEKLVERFKAEGRLTDELKDLLADDGLKSKIRGAINRDRDPSGLPRLLSVPAEAQQEFPFLYKPHDCLAKGDYVCLFRAALGRERRAQTVKGSLEREFAQRWPEERPLRQLALLWGDGKSDQRGEGVA